MKCNAILSGLAALTVLTACGSMPGKERYHGHVIQANPDMVLKCHLLGSLSSSSGLTGFFAPKGVDNVKQALLKQADAMGATHVVWDKPSTDYESTTVTGQAYECPTVAHP